MIKVGLTGGIGAGKTFISKVFVKLGVPVFNSDIEAKKCMIEDAILINKIQDMFSEKIYIDNILQKDVLADIIFSDVYKLKSLNNLVHPFVNKRFLKWSAAQNSRIVIKEAAILFESNSHLNLEKVICVSAPKDLRISRVKRRDNTSESKILDRIKNQLNQREKEELSDFIIYNDNKSLLIPQLLKVISQLN